MSSEKQIVLDHGTGAKLSQELIKQITSWLGEVHIGKMEDSAILDVKEGKIAMTTDSFVVDPVSFGNGDIGKIAVCGTVNDLAVMGAIPKYITLALMLEVGFSIEELEKIVLSIKETALEAGVKIVAESLNMLLEGNIIQEVNHKSSFMMKRLNSMKDKYPIIGDARGKGLMLGIEIIKPNENDSSGNPKANGELTNAIKHECFKRSLILENGGREGCVLRFLPALTISIDLLDESLSILEDVLKEINYYE